MENLSQPIISGTFKNIGYRSLTSVGEMQQNALEYHLMNHNIQRQMFGLERIEPAEFIRFQFKQTLFEYVSSIVPLDLYKTRSKYNNQKPLL